MKKLLYLFTFLIFSSLVFTSCGNDDDEVVTPQTGSIKAAVTPAGSATNMRITQGSTTLEIAPNSSGIFQADNLQAGEYSVTFTPAMGFQAPAARNAIVTGGNTTDLGTVTLTQPGNQFLGSMSAKVNGVSWNSIIHGATMDMGDLTITGTVPNLTGSTELIVLNIMNVTGPGTFTGPSNAVGVFTSTALGGSPSTWVSGGPTGNCTVTITNFDTANKKVSGTFSFTGFADPTSSATGTKTITNGTFTNLNIQ